MPAGWWWRGAGVALGYLVFVVISGLLTQSAFRPGYFGRLGLVAIGAVLVGYGLGPLAARLRLPLGRRIAVLFGVVFLLFSVSNLVEVALYLPTTTMVTVLVGGLVQSIGIALSLGLFFPPPDTGVRLGTALAIRSPLDWSWRVLVLAVLSVPVFMFFAFLDTPVVRAIENQGGTSSFSSPPIGELAATESTRGLLHTLVFVVIIVLLGRRWPVAWFWCALAL